MFLEVLIAFLCCRHGVWRGVLSSDSDKRPSIRSQKPLLRKMIVCSAVWKAGRGLRTSLRLSLAPSLCA